MSDYTDRQMARRKFEVVERLESATVYRHQPTGVAVVHDYKTGLIDSAHPNIHYTGSVRGMKNLGYWGKKDRVVQAGGFKYNIDMCGFGVSLATPHCQCGGKH